MPEIKRDRHERSLDRDPIVGGVRVDREGGLHDCSLHRQMAAMVETISRHGGRSGQGNEKHYCGSHCLASGRASRPAREKDLGLPAPLPAHFFVCPVKDPPPSPYLSHRKWMPDNRAWHQAPDLNSARPKRFCRAGPPSLGDEVPRTYEAQSSNWGESKMTMSSNCCLRQDSFRMVRFAW